MGEEAKADIPTLPLQPRPSGQFGSRTLVPVIESVSRFHLAGNVASLTRQNIACGFYRAVTMHTIVRSDALAFRIECAFDSELACGAKPII
ncbi:hypothetical protein A8L48_22030 [Rhizobium rhizogenes]|nr:hypothetical protein B0909_06115 [Rhizobium rhizogenes]OAM65683.1 hypothetical protein A8L48_22030 [Rhizobium rhizogenes]